MHSCFVFPFPDPVPSLRILQNNTHCAQPHDIPPFLSPPMHYLRKYKRMYFIPIDFPMYLYIYFLVTSLCASPITSCLPLAYILLTSYAPPTYLLLTSYLQPICILLTFSLLPSYVPPSYLHPVYILFPSYVPPIYLLSTSYLPPIYLIFTS